MELRMPIIKLLARSGLLPAVKRDRMVVLRANPSRTPTPALPPTPSRPPAIAPPHTGAPQFEGVAFDARGIDFDHRAEDNELAIRSSLVYFKHRYPGGTATLEGPPGFRALARRLAAEVGVPVEDERPTALTTTGKGGAD
jgi:hypothetical protein